MPFIIENEHKAFYYRGIKEYDNTKGYLKDTILQSQDNFNEMVSYFFCEWFRSYFRFERFLAFM